MNNVILHYLIIQRIKQKLKFLLYYEPSLDPKIV